MNFLHHGALGDIIYSLPTIIAFGGGDFYFGKSSQFKVLSSLLELQPYLSSVNLYDKVVKIDTNLNIYRKEDLINKHLCRCHLDPFKKEYNLSKPWISNIKPKYVADIVICRTKRYHDKREIDWSILKKYEDRLVFVGKEEERDLLEREYGVNAKHYWCKDGLEIAQIIKGSKLYIGNQSLGFSLAEAMKHPRILEVYYGKNNCQPNSNNGYTSLDESLIDFHLSKENRKDIPCIVNEDDIKSSTVLSSIFTPSDKTTVFLPNYGEFGPIIDKLVKIVHFHQSPKKIVCCKRGEEALYPSASEFFYDWEDFVKDEDKWGFFSKRKISKYVNTNYTNYKQKLSIEIDKIISKLGGDNNYFYLWNFNIDKIFTNKYSHIFRPELKPITKCGLNVDIVISPRNRKSRIESNCGFWEDIVCELTNNGYSVGSIGKEETSEKIKGISLNSWSHDDNSSAIIEMLQNCKLYIGIDTGTSHLASLLSVPMMVFFHADAYDKYYSWSTKLMEDITTNYFYNIGTGIKSPSKIIDVVLEFLSQRKTND